MKRLGLLVAVAGVCAAQNGFDGPTLGLIHDRQSGAVRKIDGIAGAARMVSAGSQHYQVAAASALKGWVLGRVDEDQPLTFGFEAKPVGGSRKGAALVVFSEAGLSAAAWYPEAGVIQVIGGMPSAPKVRSEIAVESGGVEALAVSDNGRQTAILIAGAVVIYGERQGPQDAAGGIRRLSTPATKDLSTGEELRREVISGVADIRFIESSTDLLVTTASSVFVWRSKTGALDRIAEGLDGLRAAFVGADRKFLLTASGNEIATRNLETGETAHHVCQCRPDRFTRLAANGVFLISAGRDEPVWLLDRSGADPRLVFVPSPAQAVTR